MECIVDKAKDEIYAFYDHLNNNTSHLTSRDDICTPMACVDRMIDSVPDELWRRDDTNILDPCCGNGNFVAGCLQKTDIDNIYANEQSPIRYQNCLDLLHPTHSSCSDYLCYGDGKTRFSLIIGNPPYSGGANKNRSLYQKFIRHSIGLLEDGGYLCFVTPNSWMSYNNDNETLHRLLEGGSFVSIDNDAKRYFGGVGSSFVIFVWQKGVMGNCTKVTNAFLKRDVQDGVRLHSDLPFLPLYISQPVLDLIPRTISSDRNRWEYRCDLHNHTRRDLLSDIKDDTYQYETIHTARKTRWASVRQDDIYDKWLVITPLSTYFIPFIRHNVNVTQSVGYVACDTEEEAVAIRNELTKPLWKVLIHLTRYGNFNNIMLLKHLRFGEDIEMTPTEADVISELNSLIKY